MACSVLNSCRYFRHLDGTAGLQFHGPHHQTSVVEAAAAYAAAAHMPLLLGRMLLDPGSHFLDFRALSVDDLLRHGL